MFSNFNLFFSFKRFLPFFMGFFDPFPILTFTLCLQGMYLSPWYVSRQSSYLALVFINKGFLIPDKDLPKYLKNYNRN